MSPLEAALARKEAWRSASETAEKAFQSFRSSPRGAWCESRGSIEYLASGLLPRERKLYSAAGLLVYDFDPFGRLQVLLGQKLLRSNGQRGPKGKGEGNGKGEGAGAGEGAGSGAGAGEGAGAGGDHGREYHPTHCLGGSGQQGTKAQRESLTILGGKRTQADRDEASTTAAREVGEETFGLLPSALMKRLIAGSPVLWYEPSKYAIFLTHIQGLELLPSNYDRVRDAIDLPAEISSMRWVSLEDLLEESNRPHMRPHISGLFSRKRGLAVQFLVALQRDANATASAAALAHAAALADYTHGARLPTYVPPRGTIRSAVAQGALAAAGGREGDKGSAGGAGAGAGGASDKGGTVPGPTVPGRHTARNRRRRRARTRRNQLAASKLKAEQQREEGRGGQGEREPAPQGSGDRRGA